MTPERWKQINDLESSCYNFTMPTVLRQEGYEVVIYFNDHEPAHVHTFKDAGEAKINLDPVEVIQVWNMKKQVARKAKRIVTEHQEHLLEKWKEING